MNVKQARFVKVLGTPTCSLAVGKEGNNSENKRHLGAALSLNAHSLDVSHETSFLKAKPRGRGGGNFLSSLSFTNVSSTLRRDLCAGAERTQDVTDRRHARPPR